MSALSSSCVPRLINLLMTIQVSKASMSCRTHMLTGLAGLLTKAQQESPCTEPEGNSCVGVCVAVPMNGIGISDCPVASHAEVIASEPYGRDDLPSPPVWPSVGTEATDLFSAFRLPIGRCSRRNFGYQSGHWRIRARRGDASWTAA